MKRVSERRMKWMGQSPFLVLSCVGGLAVGAQFGHAQAGLSVGAVMAMTAGWFRADIARLAGKALFR